MNFASPFRPARTAARLVLLALDPRPWSSVQDLAGESLPSSSSMTYEKNAIVCFVISALCCKRFHIDSNVSYCRALVEWRGCRCWPGCFCLTVLRLLQLLRTSGNSSMLGFFEDCTVYQMIFSPPKTAA